MYQNKPQNILSSNFSCKTLSCGVEINDLKTQLKSYFVRTFELYEKLFSIIKENKSFYTKPEPLRHPLIFYFGHTAAFFVNKFLDRGIISQRINEQYQRMFAVGVDQMDWDDLNQSHYNWPSVHNAKQYRNRVKQLVLDVIDKSEQRQINWESNLWIVMMGIEHERIHLETSAVIIRRLPVQEVDQPQWFKECPHMQRQITNVSINSIQRVPAFSKLWDRQKQNTTTYGWDNQFGHKKIEIKQFNSSKMLVSNAQYYEFIQDNGYQRMQLWSEQGKKWLKSTNVKKPLFWQISKNNIGQIIYSLRTITKIIEMPWNWPVQVNNLQAQAFCVWKSLKMDKHLRLPTQDEYFALRNLLKVDLNDWKHRSVGNINLEYWLSPNPVDMFKTQGFYDVVGNVWQHTVTPFYPFEGFQIHPNYDDFTTPTFDTRHNLIKGGSFISTGNEALYHSRYAFRRHFYQFAGFRYVQSQNQTQILSAQIDQSDQSIQKAMKIHFTQQKSYILQILDFVDQKLKNIDIKNSAVIGCSVGRLPLQFAKRYQKSYGTDYTARYFQMATRLLEQNHFKYRDVEVSLPLINLTQNILKNVCLYQMNPQNLDSKKINNVQFIVIDGFSIKPRSLCRVLKSCLKILSKTKKVYMLIVMDYQNNYIQNMEQFCHEHLQFKINFETETALTQSQKKIGKLQFLTLQNK